MLLDGLFFSNIYVFTKSTVFIHNFKIFHYAYFMLINYVVICACNIGINYAVFHFQNICTNSKKTFRGFIPCVHASQVFFHVSFACDK